ncbi:hypothetical protein [Parasedimentitalea maritima]|uniref:Transposase n=1 Tax=Parasedimentitalea maritima TaxID=2578117 RepID=A0A6A4R9X5_9RHOB|nr:hypothetical protein [Zongyanglinia marina]KAE9625501.1 hypothetical protein GP644_22560 [Zongyanglinia marina]
MAEHFSIAEWAQINALLDAEPLQYDFPERRDASVILMSWNIRKFGAIVEGGQRKKSPQRSFKAKAKPRYQTALRCNKDRAQRRW